MYNHNTQSHIDVLKIKIKEIIFKLRVKKEE